MTKTLLPESITSLAYKAYKTTGSKADPSASERRRPLEHPIPAGRHAVLGPEDVDKRQCKRMQPQHQVA